MLFQRAVWRWALAVVLVPAGLAERGWAWGEAGHELINRLAAEHLPSDVPDFMRDAQAQEAMAYFGPEPDRWRSPAEPELSAAQAPEHFIDLEYADLLGELPRRRYDYLRALAEAQKAHPDLPLSVEKVGLQPYVTEEVWERLKAGFRDYRALAAAHKDTGPIESELVFYAGWLGHYVADGSMPLHTTKEYNGWSGPNPKGYTTEHTIHAMFESTYVSANAKPEDVEPLVAAASPRLLGDEWTQYLTYLRESHRLVEPLYALEKAGAFAGAGTPAGKAMVNGQLAAGAIELRDLIYTAWVRSADPVPMPFKASEPATPAPAATAPPQAPGLPGKP